MRQTHRTLLFLLAMTMLVPLAAADTFTGRTPPTYDPSPDEFCFDDYCVGHRGTEWTDCYGYWKRTHDEPTPGAVRDKGTYVCTFRDCDPATEEGTICGAAVCQSEDTTEPSGHVASKGVCTGVIGDCTTYAWDAEGASDSYGNTQWVYKSEQCHSPASTE